MANILRIKRRATGGAGAPTTLANGELAFNEVDNILYYGVGTGGSGGSATTIPAIAGPGYVVAQTGNQNIAGTKTVTGTFDFTGGTINVPTQTNGNNTTLAASTAYVVTYAQPLSSGLTSLAAIAGNGIVARTAANTFTNRSIAGTSGRITISNGDGVSGNPTLDLASGVIGTPGTYPKVTVDTYGRVTAGANLSSGDVTTGLGYTPQDAAQKGQANGYASLGSDGLVPTSQLPASVAGAMNYQGTWNASTNTPTLTNGTGTKGYYYKVSTAGNTTIDGYSNWTVGDLIIFDGTTWDKVEGGNPDVSSVNGKVGAVNIVYGDITSGTVPVANGGTGITSYTAGDILQASGTGAFAALAAVATGNVLISGGVGTVSSWGKVGLTTHVTGTLPVGNGGTGAATFSAGYLKANGTSAFTTVTGVPFSDVTGTVPATQGGTGQTSYAVGDLLYAATTTTVGKLADVATGNVLISGGVGAAPSYGKVGLTTHVSGTLPVGNGGTGLTTYAVGDLVYASGTGTLASLADIAVGNVLISGGVGAAPSYGKVALTTHVSGTLPVANGGSGAATLTGYLKGNGTSAFTGSATIPQSDVLMSTNLAVTAAGSTQGTATALTSDLSVITSGSVNQGVILPSSSGGRTMFVVNKSGVNILVYPNTGATVDSLATNAALTLVAGASAYFESNSTSAWSSSYQNMTNGSVVVGNIPGNAANVTGTVVVANGGTGAVTLTGYVKGNGTSAMTASATIPNTDISGLGTMSTQNASAVAITGGTIDGVTIDGGTF